jgi:hypothetical protein
VEGTILAMASFATYFYFGWSMGYMKDGFSLFGLPASPDGLNMNFASHEYLMSLTAYFFPTVTTQIANVMVKRSHSVSLFSRSFLTEKQRSEIIEGIRTFSPQRRPILINIKYFIESVNQMEAARAFVSLLWNTLLLPFRLLKLGITEIVMALHKPLFGPLSKLTAAILERNYILVNFFSNPLINFGIAFELTLSFLFFYSGLHSIYFFEPVPWHVYLFAFHGTVFLIGFSEVKKYFIRRSEAR